MKAANVRSLSRILLPPLPLSFHPLPLCSIQVCFVSVPRFVGYARRDGFNDGFRWIVEMDRFEKRGEGVVFDDN